MERNNRKGYCQVCSHRDRLDIDRELVRGVKYSVVSRKYGLSEWAVSVHAKKHLSHQLASRVGSVAKMESLNIMKEIQDKLQLLDETITRAKAEDRQTLLVNALKEHRSYLALAAQCQAYAYQIERESQKQKQEKEKEGINISSFEIQRALTKLPPEAREYIEQAALAIIAESSGNTSK